MAGDASSGGINAHPMDQFIISPLFGEGWLAVTNSTLWMAIGVAIAVGMFVLPFRNATLVPSRMQSVG